MQTCKGVSLKEQELYSVIMLGEAEVEYKVGEWVIPVEGCGPLGLFATHEAARDFVDKYLLDFNDWRIYTCEFETSAYTCLWKQSGGPGLIEYPLGTLFADRIMLREPVVNGGKQNVL